MLYLLLNRKTVLLVKMRWMNALEKLVYCTARQVKMHSVDNCINRTIAPDQKHNLDQPNHWFGPLSPLWNRSSHRIPSSNLPIKPELAYYENTIHLRCIKSGCSHYPILIFPEETFLYCWHEINSNSTIILLLLPLHWGLKIPDFSTITFTYKTNSSSYTQSEILITSIRILNVRHLSICWTKWQQLRNNGAHLFLSLSVFPRISDSRYLNWLMN